MANCFLEYDDAYRVQRLPKVCMKCGRPATEYIDLTLSSPRRGDGLLGLVFDATGVNEDLTADVRAPICDRHPLMGLMIPIAITAAVAWVLLIVLVMLIFPVWVGLWFINMGIALTIVLFFYTMISDIHSRRVDGDGVHLWGVSRRFVAAYQDFLAGRESRKAKRDVQRIRDAQHTRPGDKPLLADDGTIVPPAGVATRPPKRKRKRKRVRFENTQPKREEVLRIVGILSGCWLGVSLLFILMFPPWKSKSYKRAAAAKRRAADDDKLAAFGFPAGGGNRGNRQADDEIPVPPAEIPVAAGPIGTPTDFEGLLVYLPFDEGAGNRAADASANDAAARLIGGQWTAGRRGSAAWIGGKGCYVDLGEAANLNFPVGAPFTISFWAATRQDNAILLSFRNSKHPAPLIDIRVERGKLAADVRGGRSEIGAALLKTVPFNDGRWHHVALIRKADGTVVLYLDGAQAGAVKGLRSVRAINTNIRALGRERYWAEVKSFGYPHFVGAIDEFAVFNRELTPKEISTLAGE